MQEFLEKHGYKLWKTETEQSIGVTKHYQRRIDADDIEYEGYPLCACNDKLFINMTHYDSTLHGVNLSGYTVELVHENKESEWCDLKVYCLSEQQIKDNLSKYEKKLLDMWKVFAE